MSEPAYHGVMISHPADRRARPADARHPGPGTVPTRRRVRIGAVAVALLLSVSACLPASQRPAPSAQAPATDPETLLPVDEVRSIRAPRDLAAGDPLLQTAWEAWLRMELGRLETGAYTTDALLELVLPAGVRWTVTAYGPDAYALAVTGDGEPTGLRVDPDGVHVAR